MNNIKTVLVTTALFFSVAAVTAQQQLEELLSQYNTRSVPYISVEELRMQRANSTVALLDAREPEEFAASHLPSAQLVGFNYFSIEAVSAQIKDKNTPIVVYCSLGIRSEEIGEKLKKAGFTNVKNLYGGIFEWKNKGHPVFNANGAATDSVHTFSKAWGKWLRKGVRFQPKRKPRHKS